MASINFDPVAYNHHQYCQTPPVGTWNAAKVNRVVSAPFHWITQDEADAIIHTAGEITAGWYDTQHAIPVAGVDMTPDPNYGQFLLAMAAGEI